MYQRLLTTALKKKKKAKKTQNTVSTRKNNSIFPTEGRCIVQQGQRLKNRIFSRLHLQTICSLKLHLSTSHLPRLKSPLVPLAKTTPPPAHSLLLRWSNNTAAAVKCHDKKWQEKSLPGKPSCAGIQHKAPYGSHLQRERGWQPPRCLLHPTVLSY